MPDLVAALLALLAVVAWLLYLRESIKLSLPGPHPVWLMLAIPACYAALEALPWVQRPYWFWVVFVVVVVFAILKVATGEDSDCEDWRTLICLTIAAPLALVAGAMGLVWRRAPPGASVALIALAAAAAVWAVQVLRLGAALDDAENLVHTRDKELRVAKTAKARAASMASAAADAADEDARRRVSVAEAQAKQAVRDAESLAAAARAEAEDKVQMIRAAATAQASAAEIRADRAKREGEAGAAAARAKAVRDVQAASEAASRDIRAAREKQARSEQSAALGQQQMEKLRLDLETDRAVMKKEHLLHEARTSVGRWAHSRVDHRRKQVVEELRLRSSASPGRALPLGELTDALNDIEKPVLLAVLETMEVTRDVQLHRDARSRYDWTERVSLTVEGMRRWMNPQQPNHNGPVINVHGDRAQLAWGNQSVIQNQSDSEQIAPGFEAIAQAVVSTLQELAGAGLPADDKRAAEDAAQVVLAEVVKENPDRGVVRRGVAMLKGLLSPVALGMTAGAAGGAEEWARTAIEQLGNPF